LSHHIASEGQTGDGRKYIIRKYQPEDRDRVRYICCETGFLGEPQEAVFIGRDIFADLWSSYWTDREPESAFVAEVEGRVEGYMLGCLDTRRQERIWNKEILPKVGLRMLLPTWWGKSINRKFIRAMVRSHRRGEFRVPLRKIIAEFPAHLHTNIADPSLRGQGLGGAMMRVYLDYLREHNITGVHLGTTSHNRQAVPFYEYFGFKIIAKKHLTCYDHVITDPPLYLLYMAKSL